MRARILNGERRVSPRKQLLTDKNNLYMFHLLYGMLQVTCKSFLRKVVKEKEKLFPCECPFLRKLCYNPFVITSFVCGKPCYHWHLQSLVYK